KIPAPAAEGGGDTEPRRLAGALATALPGWIDAVALHKVGEAAMDLLRAGNRHVDATQPWRAAKDPSKAGLVRDALYTLAETVRLASAVLSPITPTKSAEALRQLGAPDASDLRVALRWGTLAPGSPVDRGAVLFPRIETPT